MPAFRLSLVLCLVSLLSSCSASFNREWRAALKAGPKTGLEGAWEGTWQSESNGHHGRLRSVVGPAQNALGDHNVHYHAVWGGILRGAYRANHRVTREKDHLSFEGQHQMPNWAGGLYTYKGTVKGNDFQARYDCAMDEGTFTMKRIR